VRGEEERGVQGICGKGFLGGLGGRCFCLEDLREAENLPGVKRVGASGTVKRGEANSWWAELGFERMIGLEVG
jgi:hypothetical protein